MTEPNLPNAPQDERGKSRMPEDERAPMAQAMGIAYELMSISLEMSVIPLGGYWLDRKLDTAPIFLLVGCALGFSLGFYHLMRFASALGKKNKRK